MYGRLLGKIFCGEKLLNAELLYNGYANILTEYCPTSEFSGEKWAQEYGCAIGSNNSKNIPDDMALSDSKKIVCDPSYPEFCIPPYPPDLNCDQIQYRNFKVLPPDRHGFDHDNNGIGCDK